jgi:hypothetical protein
MARISFGIAIGIVAGFAACFGLAAIALILTDDDMQADFGD